LAALGRLAMPARILSRFASSMSLSVATGVIGKIVVVIVSAAFNDEEKSRDH
jgi:hypothetical protein